MRRTFEVRRTCYQRHLLSGVKGRSGGFATRVLVPTDIPPDKMSWELYSRVWRQILAQAWIRLDVLRTQERPVWRYNAGAL